MSEMPSYCEECGDPMTIPLNMDPESFRAPTGGPWIVCKDHWSLGTDNIPDCDVCTECIEMNPKLMEGKLVHYQWGVTLKA